MRILGLHCGHNATVFLLEDGDVRGALSQEKLDDIKNSAGFPKDAIYALLDELGLGIDDIDQVAIAGHDVFPRRCYDYLFQREASDGGSRVGTLGFLRRMESGVAGGVAPGLFRTLRQLRHKQLVT